MVDKHALQDLQNRLADRLQQVRSERVGASWLAVDAAGLGVLLPLTQAGEIFELSTLVAVPHTQAWFAGVVNHRGGICTVVDLALWLGLRRGGGESAPGGQAKLVALNPSLGVNAALRIDRLDGLRHEADLQRVDTDAEAALRPAFAPSRWRDGQGRVWQVLDLAEMARHERFLDVGQAPAPVAG